MKVILIGSAFLIYIVSGHSAAFDKCTQLKEISEYGNVKNILRALSLAELLSKETSGVISGSEYLYLGNDKQHIHTSIKINKEKYIAVTDYDFYYFAKMKGGAEYLCINVRENHEQNGDTNTNHQLE